MWDAYTISQRYPYSTPQRFGRGFDVNYIRNAAKVVVDAYDGTVDYYIADETDPILKTYAKIFPGVFKPISKMPADLLAHIRYPELLFSVQSRVLLTYHMRDPQVFYNKGDQWDIPKEIVQTSDEQAAVEPYYVVMKLPDEEKEQFLLMLPFTPINKDNMIAWMAAKCDPEVYGEMILYQFPKKELIYGPAQIESRVNQDPVISPQLTLWGQKGSRVNRGNLLVIPIEESIIYVEPLYLESETSKIPELKRVIVAYGNHIAMEQTLDDALERIFGGAAAGPPGQPPRAGPAVAGPPGAGMTPEARRLINQAVTQFNRAEELQRQGDWAGYGEQLRRLEQTLVRLRQETGGG